MDENEFEISGKIYVANHDKTAGCRDCACFLGFVGCLAILNDGPSCFGAERKDGVDVIFLERQQ